MAQSQREGLLLSEVCPYLCGAINLLDHSIRRLEPHSNLPVCVLSEFDLTFDESRIAELGLSLVLKQRLEEQEA